METRTVQPRLRKCNSYAWILGAIDMMKTGVSNTQVALTYGISPSTVSIWKRKCYELEMNSPGQNPVLSLDGELFRWYLSSIKEGQYVSGAMIQEKAKEINFKITGIDNFSPSHVWATKWRKRHGIIQRRQRKSSQQLETSPPPNVDNHVNQAIYQNLPVTQKFMDSTNSLTKIDTSSIYQNMAQKFQYDNINEKEELEDDDDILKELDNMLSVFQRKIIDRYYESDEDCSKRNIDNDDMLLPSAKMLVTEGQVAKIFSETVENESKKKNRRKSQVNRVTKMIDVQEILETGKAVEESVIFNNKGITADKEKQIRDSISSEKSTEILLTEESCNEKDEEDLECLRKKGNIKASKNKIGVENCINQTKSPLPILDSIGITIGKKQKLSSNYGPKKSTRKVSSKYRKVDTEPALNIDNSNDEEHGEDSLNVVEKTVKFNYKGITADKEKQICDSVSSEKSTEMSLTEGSCNEKDEDLECLRKKGNIKASKHKIGVEKCINQTKSPLPILDSTGRTIGMKEKLSSNCGPKKSKRKVSSKYRKVDTGPALNIGNSNDEEHGEDSVNVVEKTVKFNNNGITADKEKQIRDSVSSEKSLEMSLTEESCNEKDEDLECLRKKGNIKACKRKIGVEKCINQTKSPLPILNSTGRTIDMKEKLSSNYGPKKSKRKVSSKYRKVDTEPALNIGNSSDKEHGKDILNSQELKTEVKKSVLSESKVIVVSSEEDSDDDVIYIGNESETIVIDTSDGEENEESYQEESHQQHSECKIILLNTKEGGEDFSIMDSGSMESIPKVIIFSQK